MPQLISRPALDPCATTAIGRPLCVDLDGTLVKSDTLIDSLLVLARSRPALLMRLPGRLLRGKASLKAFVSESVSLDAANLPYNQLLLTYLRDEHQHGRELCLATGADQRLAHEVAEHLGIFTRVLASDGATNLTGANKLETLRQQFPHSAFDYIGNDVPDLPLLAGATQPMVANPSLGLRRRLKARDIQPAQTFIEHKPFLASLLRALRPHQWAKNLLVVIPLLCSHALSVNKLLVALTAFGCFSLIASSAYIVNDLLDIEADRRHPVKRLRPFAAADLSATSGVAIAVVLLAAGLAGARLLPGHFVTWMLIYLAMTLAYSWYLKRFALVDVMTLSILYILRLLAGGSATVTPISHWLAGFSMFLFLSLAIVKRFAELENLRADQATLTVAPAASIVPGNGRGYLLTDMDQLRTFGTASAYAAVVVFAIYISGTDVVKLYHRSPLLWLIVPLMTLWLNRVWLLASRGKLDEDPVAFALTDSASQFIGLLILMIALLAL